jgi:hypothetical protein
MHLTTDLKKQSRITVSAGFIWLRRDKWQALMNRVMDLMVPYMAGNALAR